MQHVTYLMPSSHCVGCVGINNLFIFLKFWDPSRNVSQLQQDIIDFVYLKVKTKLLEKYTAEILFSKGCWLKFADGGICQNGRGLNENILSKICMKTFRLDCSAECGLLMTLRKGIFVSRLSKMLLLKIDDFRLTFKSQKTKISDKTFCIFQKQFILVDFIISFR